MARVRQKLGISPVNARVSAWLHWSVQGKTPDRKIKNHVPKRRESMDISTALKTKNLKNH